MNLNQFPALSLVKTVALDLDGVVYVGNKSLPGAVAAISAMRELGLKVWFVTNNSGRTRAEIAGKLTLMDIPATEGQVLTSGYAAGFLLRRLTNPSQPSVLVVGSASLKAEITQLGFHVVTDAPCDFLVVGFDQNFHYGSICTALDALLGGASFVACNRDARFPGEDGRFLPGCGAMVSAIEHAGSRKAEYEVGKPNTLFLQMIASVDNLAPHEILVVGDSLASDIIMARRFGSPSVLVSTREINPPAEIQPTVALSALADLPPLLLAAHQDRRTVGGA